MCIPSFREGISSESIIFIHDTLYFAKMYVPCTVCGLTSEKVYTHVLYLPFGYCKTCYNGDIAKLYIHKLPNLWLCQVVNNWSKIIVIEQWIK